MNKFKNLTNTDMKEINGGKRHVLKIDRDNDGRWDDKYIWNSRTGKWRHIHRD